jgi:hypothetical protein
MTVHVVGREEAGFADDRAGDRQVTRFVDLHLGPT